MKYTIFEISMMIFVTLFIVFEWFLYARFRKSLKFPFKAFKPINNKDLLTGYPTTDSLYKSYKKLSKANFKVIKMSVRSFDPDLGFIQQLIDLFTKLIFTIALALMSITITIFSSLLNNLNANKEELKKLDNSAWVKNLNGTLQGFLDGLETYQKFFFIALMIFILAINHTLLYTAKKNIHKRHLTIIEEIEKEYSQK